MVNIQHFWESEISTWGDDSSVTDDEVDEVDEIQRTGTFFLKYLLPVSVIPTLNYTEHVLL